MTLAQCGDTGTIRHLGSPHTAAWRPAAGPTGRLTIWPLPAGGGGHISYWHLIGTGKGLMVAGNLDQRSNLTYPTGIRIYHRHHNNNRTNTSQQRPDFLHIRKCPRPTAAARRRAVTSPFWLCAAVRCSAAPTTAPPAETRKRQCILSSGKFLGAPPAAPPPCTGQHLFPRLQNLPID